MIPTKSEMLAKLNADSQNTETYNLENTVSEYIKKEYKGTPLSFSVTCSTRKVAQDLLALIKAAGYEVYYSKFRSNDLFAEDTKSYEFHVS